MSLDDGGLDRIGRFLSGDAGDGGNRERIGHYRFLDVLGRGGMGIVYRARDEALGREVALKIPHPDAVRTESALSRFEREMRNAARLRHPGVVTVYEAGREGDVLYYAMELIHGKAFQSREGDLETRVRILEKAARAVAYAHGQGVIHRDLKPGNILVDEQGEPRVVDFGLSLDMTAESDLTRTGALLGTLPYMSPEQAGGGAGEVDARSDVYSLGAILYEILSGRPPFADAPSVRRLLVEDPAPPSGPRDLVLVCLKALARTPAGRYPTAEAFADDLARFLRGEPVGAGFSLGLYRLRRWWQRHRIPVLAAAVIVAFVAGLAWNRGAWGGRRSPPVGQWKFLEGSGRVAADSSGRGHAGSIVGNPMRTSGGVLQLNGVDDYVELPDAPALARVQEGSYTISAWFRPSSIPPGKKDADPDFAYAIVTKTPQVEGLWYDNQGRFVMTHFLADGGDADAEPDWTGAGTWKSENPPGRWYHLVGVVDTAARETRLFVDGEFKDLWPWAKDAGPGAFPRPGHTWKIGVLVPGAGEAYSWFAKGSVGDVRIHDRVLSASEIREIFQEGFLAK